MSSRLVLAALLVGAAAGVARLLHAIEPHGIGIAQTALHHFTAAEALRAGEIPTLSRGEPFMMWPPLLTILLAAAKSLGLSYATAGLLLNLASYAATLVLGPLLVLRLFGSPGAAVATLLVLLVSPELFQMWLPLHTDPLFLALVLATLVALTAYLGAPTRPRLAGVAALATLACLQRYPGIALALSTAAILALHPASLAARARIARAAAFAAVALLPLAAWMVFNRVQQASWGTLEVEPTRGFAENGLATVATAARLLVPGEDLGAPRAIAALAAAALLLGLLAASALRDGDPVRRRAWTVFLAFPAAYVAMLVVATSRVRLEPITARYLAPLYPFLWGALLLGAAEALRRLRAAPAAVRVGTSVAVLALFGAHLAAAEAQTSGLAARSRSRGSPGFEADWNLSPLVGWLRAHELPGAVYSNVPEVVLFARDHRATYVTPESLRTMAEGAEGADRQAIVVWSQIPRAAPPLPEIADLRLRFATVARLPDGAVYRVEPDPYAGEPVIGAAAPSTVRSRSGPRDPE